MAGRARAACSIGMMDGAFFVSRTELLLWVNGVLNVNVAKVEQCASGAIYCQILDACHPGTIAMGKVNWMAKVDHEFVPNYKVLQAAFDRHKIERNIPVDLLIKAKYQDNLEFLQWMKCYWERSGAGAGNGYDPVERRQGKKLPAWAVARGCACAKESACPTHGVKPSTAPRSTSARSALGDKENARPRSADARDASKPGAASRSSPARRARDKENASPRRADPIDASKQFPRSGSARILGDKENVRPRTADPADVIKPSPAPRNCAAKPVALSPRSTLPKAPLAEPKSRVHPGVPALHGLQRAAHHNEEQPAQAMHSKEEVDELRDEAKELQRVMLGLEEERDFYFHRLRKVELLCKQLGEEVAQSNEGRGKMPACDQAVDDVLAMLYKTSGCLMNSRQAIAPSN